MNGRYVGYLAGDDPLHGFLRRIILDRMEVREAHPAFRVFRLSGSNVVYAYQEKFSGTSIICKFYGPRFADLDKAAWMARQEYEGLETLRQYNLIGSPHHVIRPLGFSRDINGVLAVEYYAGEEFSQAITRATQHRDDRHLYRRLTALASFLAVPVGSKATRPSKISPSSARACKNVPASETTKPWGRWYAPSISAPTAATSTRSRAGSGRPAASGPTTPTSCPGCGTAGGNGR